MSRRVLTAMLNIDANQFSGGNANTFSTAVSQAAAALNVVAHTRSATKLFVAPEYYFSYMDQPFDNDGTPAPVSKDYKHYLYSSIKEISSQHSDVIIVAGSIFYTKTKGLIRKSTVGLNVCPVLKNGEFLYKYYKKNDDGNLKKADINARFEHKSTNPVFKSDGIQFGIEVCLDHNDNVLRDWVNTGNSRVDIHLYISATNTHRVSNLQARTGGYVVHCDMLSEKKNKHAVLKQTGPEVTYNQGKATIPLENLDPTYTSNTLGNGSTVSVYVLTL